MRCVIALAVTSTPSVGGLVAMGGEGGWEDRWGGGREGRWDGALREEVQVGWGKREMAKEVRTAAHSLLELGVVGLDVVELDDVLEELGRRGCQLCKREACREKSVGLEIGSKGSTVLDDIRRVQN